MTTTELASAMAGCAMSADTTDRMKDQGQRERHLEEKASAIFWLRDLILSELKEEGDHFLGESGSASHWIASGRWPGINGRQFHVPGYFQRMSRTKIARFVEWTLRELAGQGELIKHASGHYRKTTILEKLAKLGG